MSLQDLLIVPIAFAVTVVLGFILLPLLRRIKIGQTVRDDGPQSHFVKSGTPTMGALMFVLPVQIYGFVLSFISGSSLLFAMMLLTTAMAAIGFLDDYIKVRVRKEGLSPKQKTIPMLLAISAFVFFYLYLAPMPPLIHWPFGLGTSSIEGIWRLLYGLFLVVFMYFTINAVNITDGVDGLLSTLSIPVFFSLSWALLSSYNALGSREAALVALALIGGFLGFLVFNHHPAKIFMGDTGSLAIGALFSAIVVYMGAPWLLLLTGFVYLAEAMSVVIQVLYFKKTKGKRIFRMSPIHHHFELGGWKENKVVIVFTLIALLGSVLGLLALGSGI